jgi:hypothetical protein
MNYRYQTKRRFDELTALLSRLTVLEWTIQLDISAPYGKLQQVRELKGAIKYRLGEFITYGEYTPPIGGR